MNAELLAWINSQAWAMLPEALAGLVARAKAAGAQDGRPQVAPTAAANGEAQAAGAVAVLPLVGTIRQRGGGLFEMFFGGASTQRFTAALRQALADGSIGAIVIDVDSPGGTVSGVDELAAEIFRARGIKPIVAVANPLAASAAYWISSAATELFVTPTGQVGSIGVWSMHVDDSKWLEMVGEKVTLISAGKYKVEGNPYEPLGDEARAAMQADVDEYYGMFVRAVARNRGASAGDVRGGMGEGRVVTAKRAVELGMADRVGTLEDAVARAGKLAQGGGKPSNRRADAAARAVLAGV